MPGGVLTRSVRAAYDAVGADYAAHVGGELAGKPADRALLDAVAGRAAGGVVGDLGAGPGHVAAYLAGRGARAVAVDLSPGILAAGRAAPAPPAARAAVGGGAGGPAAGGGRVAAVAGDLLALPLRDGCLAGAVAFYSLIHLPPGTETAALSEVARVLAPGAEVLVSFHVGDEVRHLGEWWGHDVDLDFRFFAVEEMTGWMATAGLDVAEVTERDAYPEVEVATRRAYVRAVKPGT